MNLVFASGFLIPQHLLGINYFREWKPISRAGTRPSFRWCRRLPPSKSEQVCLRTASSGRFQQPFWLCDHADMTGHNLDTDELSGFRFDHFAAIDAIIAQL